MPKINFPNVPIAEGVPNLARSAYSLAQKTGTTGRVMGLTGGLAGTFLGHYLNAMLAPTYALLNQKEEKVITPDGPAEFEMKGDASVSTYPVELGGFQSYNKVINPEDLSLSLLCNGQGPMSHKDFLKACHELKNGIDVIKLVTPKYVYPYVICTGMSHQTTARNGVTLLKVNLTFKEIRVTGTTSFPNAKTDSGAVMREGGQSSAQTVDTSSLPLLFDGFKSEDGVVTSTTVNANWLDTLTSGYDQLSEIDNDAQRYFGKLGVG